MASQGLITIPAPRLVAWESTQACNLTCRHCRASALSTPPADELGPTEALDVLNQLTTWTPPPMVILSGGEPLLRPDILDLVASGRAKGLRMLLSTNGWLLDTLLARALKTAGVARVSLSLDYPNQAAHDAFRNRAGSFDRLIEGAARLVEAGLPFQINSTLTSDNLHLAGDLTSLAQKMGAIAHHVFLLVPVGRAETLETNPLAPETYETALKNLRQRETSLSLEFKVTCAPQYQRLGQEMNLPPQGRHAAGRGCLAGQGFLFISSKGEVRGCGYLPLPTGNIKQTPLRKIYETSSLFRDLRDPTRYHGACGSCKYFTICGGCRARALAAGDHLGPEPLCPRALTKTIIAKTDTATV